MPIRDVLGGSDVLHSAQGMPDAPQSHGREVAPLAHGRSSCASHTHPVLSQRLHAIIFIAPSRLLSETGSILPHSSIRACFNVAPSSSIAQHDPTTIEQRRIIELTCAISAWRPRDLETRLESIAESLNEIRRLLSQMQPVRVASARGRGIGWSRSGKIRPCTHKSAMSAQPRTAGAQPDIKRDPRRARRRTRMWRIR